MVGRGEEFRGWTKVHSFSYNGIVKTCNMETKKECEGGEVMAEYINRDKAKRLLHIEGEYAAEQLLDEIPASDVVPVVRCRECKHHYWEQEPCHGKSVHYCNLPHMSGVEVFKEFFCYYGERQEG